MNNRIKIALFVVLVLLVLLGAGAAVYFSPEVKAHQRGVLVNLYGEHKGVQAKELPPGKYIWFVSGFNPLTQKLFIVDIAESNLELINSGPVDGKQEEAEAGGVVLETRDGAVIHADVSIWYRILPDKADVFVTTVAPGDVAGLLADTARSVIRAKSGYFEVEEVFNGRIKEKIADLSRDGMNEELGKRGMEVVSVEFKNLVFSDEITAKLTEKILSAKDIEINKNKTLAAAEASKAVEVKSKAKIQQAEADKRSTVLASEARKIEAMNSMEADKMRAVGILAVGKAKAEVKAMEMKTYEGAGGDRYMRVKIAEALGHGMSNWKIVPQNTDIDAIVEKFYQAIKIAIPAVQTNKQEQPGVKTKK